MYDIILEYCLRSVKKYLSKKATTKKQKQNKQNKNTKKHP